MTERQREINWPETKLVPLGTVHYRTDRERDINNQGWNACLAACRKSYDEAQKRTPSPRVLSVEDIEETIRATARSVELSNEYSLRLAQAIHSRMERWK